MMILGEVLEIFSTTKESSGLPRPKVVNLNLIENHGIELDKFAKKNLDQTVMIVGIKSYQLAKANNIDLELGSLGENILVDFDPHDFKVGTCFKIGDAVIQTTQICTVCNHLSVFDKNLPKLLKGQRGIYCKIIKSGKILKNMNVEEL